jgi:hypothetical protein
MEWIIKTVITAILVLIGAREVISNLRIMLSNKPPDIEHDSALSKYLFSPYTRYWIGRYHGPFEGIVSGLLLIAVAALIYFYR